MTNEQTLRTYVGGADIRMENVERRDRLVKAAEEAGFDVEYTEAIDIGWGGETSPEHWAISVFAKGKLSDEERIEARKKLRNAWMGK